MSKKTYTLHTFYKEIDLGLKMVKKLIQAGEIKPYEKHGEKMFFYENEVRRIKEKQQEIISQIDDIYFIDYDIVKEVDLGKTSLQNWVKEKGYQEKVIELPDIAKIKNEEVDYTRVALLYSKELKEEFIKEKTIIKNKREITDSDLTIKEKYDLMISVNKIKPLANDKETEELWNEFIKEKSETIFRDAERDFVKQLVDTKKALNDVLGEDILSNITSADIALRMRTNRLKKTVSKRLLEFLNHCKTKNENVDFNMDMIKEKTKKETVNLNKEVYQYQEYIQLVEKIKDINITRSLIEKDAYKELNYLLFLVVAVSNAWRENDIVSLERPHEALLKKEVSREIVEYYTNKYLKHQKTDTDRMFVISEKLEKVFTEIVLYLERYLEENEPFYKKIMNFPNKENKPNKRIMNNFIKDELGIDNFDFSIRKMNRTVISLVYSATKTFLDRDSLELTQKYRGHTSYETTNIYIKLNQNEIDYIVDNLFNKGNFGFVYDGLQNILKDNADEFENTMNLQLLNEMPLMISESFKNKQEIYKAMQKMDKEQLKTKTQEIDLGLSVSKNEKYQCLIGVDNCEYQKECTYCPFSIPNRLTLSYFTKDLKERISEFKEKLQEAKSNGERTKLSNQLAMYMNNLKEMIDFFGREVVDLYIDGGLESVNVILRDLPSFKKYITIGG